MVEITIKLSGASPGYRARRMSGTRKMQLLSVPAELTGNSWGVTCWKRKTINDLLKQSCECVNRGTQIVNGVKTAA